MSTEKHADFLLSNYNYAGTLFLFLDALTLRRFWRRKQTFRWPRFPKISAECCNCPSHSKCVESSAIIAVLSVSYTLRPRKKRSIIIHRLPRSFFLFKVSHPTCLLSFSATRGFGITAVEPPQPNKKSSHIHSDDGEEKASTLFISFQKFYLSWS